MIGAPLLTYFGKIARSCAASPRDHFSSVDHRDAAASLPVGATGARGGCCSVVSDRYARDLFFWILNGSWDWTVPRDRIARYDVVSMSNRLNGRASLSLSSLRDLPSDLELSFLVDGKMVVMHYTATDNFGDQEYLGTDGSRGSVFMAPYAGTIFDSKKR